MKLISQQAGGACIVMGRVQVCNTRNLDRVGGSFLGRSVHRIKAPATRLGLQDTVQSLGEIQKETGRALVLIAYN